MVKFLFTPLAGPAAGLTFIETYFSCVGGAILSSAIFYFASEYFFNRAKQKQLALLESGKLQKVKKKFTKTNKFIVRLKSKFGVIGISILAPLFLSIPVGTMITAKFYGKKKITYPLIVLGIFLNGLVITGLTYLSASGF